jgi:hypothetical protein
MSIEQLNPITTDQVAGLVSPETKAHLAEHLMMTAVPHARTARTRRRRLFIGVPAVAVTAAAAVVALSAGLRIGPVSVGPPVADAAPLAISQQGKYVIVRVTNPYVDPARYRKELAAYGLNVDLRLEPTSAAEVGQVLGEEDDGGGTTLSTAVTHCQDEFYCVAIPSHYKWFVRIIFGRPARPGESYQSGTDDVVMNGVKVPDVSGDTVSQALTVLNAKHLTRLSYRYEYHDSDEPYPEGVPAAKVQPGWYVHSYALGEPAELILFVGPDRTEDG